ncbi:MAG TPA: hypothetical protein VF898_09560 [Chloroflexota bacterium]
MASNDRRQSGRVITLAATAALLSPHVRRLVRTGMGYALARAVKAGSIVVRGTRNLQEASKHVTKFEADNPKGDS